MQVKIQILKLCTKWSSMPLGNIMFTVTVTHHESLNPAILYQTMHIQTHTTYRQQHKHPEDLSTQSRPHTADRNMATSTQYEDTTSYWERATVHTHHVNPARNAGVHVHTEGKKRLCHFCKRRNWDCMRKSDATFMFLDLESVLSLNECLNSF